MSKWSLRSTISIIISSAAMLCSGCGDDGAAPDGGMSDSGPPAMCADPGSRNIDEPCQCESDCAGTATCDFEDVDGYPGGACLYACVPGTDDCGSDAECLDLGAEVGICVRTCTTTADCGGPGRVCDTAFGRCFFLCQGNDECLSGHCDPYTGACTDGTPSTGKGSLEECVRHEECRSGTCESVQHRCISSCVLTDPLCPRDEACVSSAEGGTIGICQPRCMVDDDCAALGLVCRTTSTPLGTFRVCAQG